MCIRDSLFFLPKEKNWWIAGAAGPCGPDTEMFLDTGKPACGPDCSPACDCGKYLEIWNNVFMQYNKTPEGKYERLSQKNVDTDVYKRQQMHRPGGEQAAAPLVQPVEQQPRPEQRQDRQGQQPGRSPTAQHRHMVQRKGPGADAVSRRPPCQGPQQQEAEAPEKEFL